MRHYPIDFDVDKQEDEPANQNKILSIAALVVGLVIVVLASFVVLSREGDANPNIVGQDELASYIEAHPELRDGSGHSE